MLKRFVKGFLVGRISFVKAELEVDNAYQDWLNGNLEARQQGLSSRMYFIHAGLTRSW